MLDGNNPTNEFSLFVCKILCLFQEQLYFSILRFIPKKELCNDLTENHNQK